MTFMRGQLDRRIVAVYRVCPEVLGACLPTPLQPRSLRGMGLLFTCLNCVKQWRPAFLPAEFGISIYQLLLSAAVEWDSPTGTRTGTHVLWQERCSQNRMQSRLLLGASKRLEICESLDHLDISVESSNQPVFSLSAFICPTLPHGSVFQSVREVSDFLDSPENAQSSALPESKRGCYLPLHVEQIRNWLIDDPQHFPLETIEFDSAFLIRREARRWKPAVQEASAAYRWQLAPVTALSSTALHRSRNAPSLSC